MINGIEKFLSKYKQGPEAVIVNLSSLAGLISVRTYPIYSATKSAVIGMTRSWGHEEIYEKTKVRVLAVCPGVTNTPMTENLFGRTRKNPLYYSNDEYIGQQ